MRRAAITAGLGLVLSTFMILPATGQTRGEHDQIDREAAETTAEPVADAKPRPVPEKEELRLTCHGRTNDEGSALVGCEWSPTKRDAAAAYVLVRSNGDQRETIWRSNNLSITHAVDSTVRPGVVYAYSILVLNSSGSTIGQGGPVRAGVETPSPGPEVLHLSCNSTDERNVVGCAWRPAASSRAGGYQLWRIIDQDHRVLVWRGGLDSTRARDRVPADASVAVYAVLAVDANGEVVGQSRPETVRLGGPAADRPKDREDKAPWVHRWHYLTHGNTYR